jgi:hypothetical protein
MRRKARSTGSRSTRKTEPGLTPGPAGRPAHRPAGRGAGRPVSLRQAGDRGRDAHDGRNEAVVAGGDRSRGRGRGVRRTRARPGGDGPDRAEGGPDRPGLAPVFLPAQPGSRWQSAAGHAAGDGHPGRCRSPGRPADAAPAPGSAIGAGPAPACHRSPFARSRREGADAPRAPGRTPASAPDARGPTAGPDAPTSGCPTRATVKVPPPGATGDAGESGFSLASPRRRE